VELNLLKQEIHFRTTSVINTESQLGKNVNNVERFFETRMTFKNMKGLFMINLIYQRIMLDQERSQTNQETLSDVLIAIKRLRIEHA
jgi:hypothetical protein